MQYPLFTSVILFPSNINNDREKTLVLGKKIRIIVCSLYIHLAEKQIEATGALADNFKLVCSLKMVQKCRNMLE
jgi:hypothetical protein